MVLIPGGTFVMGKGFSKDADFSPQHQVKISSFYINRFEVTNKEYYNLVHDNLT